MPPLFVRKVGKTMEKIENLSIDLETFSSVDLNKCGVYKYAESDDFEILLFGVSVNGKEPVVYDLLQGETLLIEIIKALVDDTVTLIHQLGNAQWYGLLIWVCHYPLPEQVSY